jgi:hypothetical protein
MSLVQMMGFAGVVPAVDEAADCAFEVADRIEGAAPDGFPGDDLEEDFDHAQP